LIGTWIRPRLSKYGLETGLSAEVMGLCVHSLRATAATNALSHDSDIAKVQYIKEDGTKRFAKNSRKHGCSTWSVRRMGRQRYKK
jgi:hypothetical protein